MKIKAFGVPDRHKFKSFVFVLGVFLSHSFVSAQTLSSGVDSTSVRLGQLMRYNISVKVDSLVKVVFPSNKSFLNLEVADSSEVDTVIAKNHFKLSKSYGIIGFDEKIKSVPQLSVQIGSKVFKTDSIPIEIRTVAVDTISKEYYDAKPMVEVEDVLVFSWSIVVYSLIILLVLIAGFLIYKYKYKKIEKKRKEQLPPFEEVKIRLQKLSHSDYLTHNNYKGYYSELTNTLKDYLEKEISMSVLESTSKELMVKLKTYILKYEIKIQDAIIEDMFNKVLHHSDMAKFAKSPPDRHTVEQDYLIVERVIHEINRTLPFSILQEKRDREIDEQAQRALRRKKNIKYAVYAVIGFLIITLTVVIVKNGVRRTFDTVVGNSTLKILNQPWVTATYGFPPVELQTPDILRRIESDSLQGKIQMVKSTNRFHFGDFKQGSSIDLRQVTFATPQSDEGQMAKVLEGFIKKTIASLGGENIIMKQDELTTLRGSKGIKSYGSFEYNGTTSMKYVIVTFINQEGLTQLELFYRKGDYYADEIEERILNSLNFKKTSE